MKILKVINDSLFVIDKEDKLTMEFFCSKDISFKMKLNIKDIFRYKNESTFIDSYISKNRELINNDLLNKINKYLLSLKVNNDFYIIYNLNHYKYEQIKFPTKKSDKILNKLINVLSNDSEIDISVTMKVFCSKKDIIYNKMKKYEDNINDLYKEKDNYNGIMNYLKSKKIEKSILEMENEFNEYVNKNLNNYLDYFKEKFEDLKIREDLYDELMQYGLLYSKEKVKFRILIHHYEKIIHCFESFKKESKVLNNKEYELLVSESVNDFEIFIIDVMNELKKEIINKISEVLVNDTKLDNDEKLIINNEKVNSIKTNIFSKK